MTTQEILSLALEYSRASNGAKTLYEAVREVRNCIREIETPVAPSITGSIRLGPGGCWSYTAG
jgi:hypothetical protein